MSFSFKDYLDATIELFKILYSWILKGIHKFIWLLHEIFEK